MQNTDDYYKRKYIKYKKKYIDIINNNNLEGGLGKKDWTFVICPRNIYVNLATFINPEELNTNIIDIKNEDEFKLRLGPNSISSKLNDTKFKSVWYTLNEYDLFENGLGKIQNDNKKWYNSKFIDIDPITQIENFLKTNTTNTTKYKYLSQGSGSESYITFKYYYSKKKGKIILIYKSF